MSRDEWQQIRRQAWRMRRRRLRWEGVRGWERVTEPMDRERATRIGPRMRLEILVSRRKAEATRGTIAWQLAMMRRMGI